VPEGSSLASDARPADEDMNLDDSPNMRACLVSTDDEPGIFQRIYADIFTSTIHDLTEILKREFKREGPHRIRDLLLKKLYSKEDEGMLLKTFSQFEEGGARLTLERGSACSINEIALKIEHQDNVTKEKMSQDFIFNSEYIVQKCKSEICDAFGLEPAKFTLFRYDAFGAPGFAIRKEKAGWIKNNVSSGDVLALCSNDGLSADNKFHLSIHATNTGFSDDCKFLGEIDVSKTLKLDDLREQIATMNHFQERGRTVANECMRLRDLNPANRYFGRIHRDQEKTLQNIGIKNKGHIVVQVLDEPEQLDAQTSVLLLCRRQVEARTYSEKIPHKYTYSSADKHPTIQSLKASCREFFNLASGEHIDLCKFIPWEFEWRFLDPNQMVEERMGKKGKKKQLVKAGNMDLRKFPHFLNDGDIIGVRIGAENTNQEDDFQTDADLIAKSEFNLINEQH
jgi:hypothetical protein